MYCEAGCEENKHQNRTYPKHNVYWFEKLHRFVRIVRPYSSKCEKQCKKAHNAACTEHAPHLNGVAPSDLISLLLKNVPSFLLISIGNVNQEELQDTCQSCLQLVAVRNLARLNEEDHVFEEWIILILKVHFHKFLKDLLHGDLIYLRICIQPLQMLVNVRKYARPVRRVLKFILRPRRLFCHEQFVILFFALCFGVFLILLRLVLILFLHDEISISLIHGAKRHLRSAIIFCLRSNSFVCLSHMYGSGRAYSWTICLLRTICRLRLSINIRLALTQVIIGRV